MAPSTLYSPEVPPDATPPRAYPPTPGMIKELTAAMALAAAAALPLPPPVLLVMLTTVGYVIVSHVFLERRRLLGSRYDVDTGASTSAATFAVYPCEWMKMLAIIPAVWVCAVQYHLAPDNEHRRPFSTVVLATGMYVGIHVVYLDRFPVLQSFGCKVVRGWHGIFDMNAIEWTVFLLFALCGLATVTGVGHHFLLSKDGPYGLARIICVYLAFGATIVGLRCLPKFRGAAFHSHHYFNSLLFLPLTSYPGNLPCFLCGLALGSFVEGCACWGVDPILFDPFFDGADFGVLFWTSLVPLMTLPSKRRTWVALLHNIGALAEAAEQRGVRCNFKEAGDWQCLACVGDDTRLQRARRITRDVESASLVWGFSEKMDSCPNAATLALVDVLKKCDSKRKSEGENVECCDIMLLAYAETVLLGLMLGSQDLLSMATNSGFDSGSSGSASFECLLFDGEYRAGITGDQSGGVQALQHAFRGVRASLGPGQRKLLLEFKRQLMLALFND